MILWNSDILTRIVSLGRFFVLHGVHNFSEQTFLYQVWHLEKHTQYTATRQSYRRCAVVAPAIQPISTSIGTITTDKEIKYKYVLSFFEKFAIHFCEKLHTSFSQAICSTLSWHETTWNFHHWKCLGSTKSKWSKSSSFFSFPEGNWSWDFQTWINWG